MLRLSHSVVHVEANKYVRWLEVLLLWEMYWISNAANVDVEDMNRDQMVIMRKLMQSLNWRYSEWSMAECVSAHDCSWLGSRMSCIDGNCGCDDSYVLVENKLTQHKCFPKASLFASCTFAEQCLAMNRNTYCSKNNRCTCSPGYYFDGQDCIMRYDTNLKAQEVYKAAVVAAACFIVAVVGIFVACIVRRSFCRRESNVQHASSSSSDIFSVSDEIAALRAVDKPPSYEEVLQIERTFYGIPPPEYNFSSDSSHQCNRSTSAACEISGNNSREQNSTTFIPHGDATAVVHNNPSVATAIVDSATSWGEEVPRSAASNLHVENYSSASPHKPGQDVQHSSVSSSRFLCSSPPQQSLRVLGLPSSVSAPNSPRSVSHWPHLSATRALLQRLSSLKLHPTATPNVPTTNPPEAMTVDTSSAASSALRCPEVIVTDNGVGHSSSLNDDPCTAYDNPAFIDDQK